MGMKKNKGETKHAFSSFICLCSSLFHSNPTSLTIPPIPLHNVQEIRYEERKEKRKEQRISNILKRPKDKI